MPEYQFFITEGPDGKFQSANQAIRSHAMKTALGRRAQSAADKAHPASSATSSSRKTHKKNGLKGKYRLQSCSSRLNQANLNNETQQQPAAGGLPRQDSQRECEPPTPPITGFDPGNGIFDPFKSLPIPLTRWVDRLVKYFLANVRLNTATVDAQRSWFSYAVQSPLVMHATLATTASFWAANCESSSRAMLVHVGSRHHGEALRGIRARLRKQKTGADVTNEVIAGIACLITAAIYDGDFATASIHLEGMRDVAAARTSTKPGPEMYILCRCFKCIDLQVASALGRQPLYLLPSQVDDSLLPPAIVQLAPHPSLTHLDALEPDRPDPTAALRTIFLILRRMIRARDPSYSASSSCAILLAHSAECYLLAYLFGGEEPGSPKLTLLGLAAHVFVYRAMHELQGSALMNILVARLWRALMGKAGGDWKQYESGGLMWVAFVGMTGAVDGSEEWRGFKRVFAETLGAAVGNGEVRSWEDVQAMLTVFLWDEEVCRPLLDRMRQEGELRVVLKTMWG